MFLIWKVDYSNNFNAYSTEWLDFAMAGFVHHYLTQLCISVFYSYFLFKIPTKEAMSILPAFILHIHTHIHTIDVLLRMNTAIFSHTFGILSSLTEMSIWKQPNIQVVVRHGSFFNSLIFLTCNKISPLTMCVCAGHGYGDPRKAGVRLHQ